MVFYRFLSSRTSEAKLYYKSGPFINGNVFELLQVGNVEKSNLNSFVEFHRVEMVSVV